MKMQQQNFHSEDDSFDLKSLEKLYIDRLAEIGKLVDSHIT